MSDSKKSQMELAKDFLAKKNGFSNKKSKFNVTNNSNVKANTHSANFGKVKNTHMKKG